MGYVPPPPPRPLATSRVPSRPDPADEGALQDAMDSLINEGRSAWHVVSWAGLLVGLAVLLGYICRLVV